MTGNVTKEPSATISKGDLSALESTDSQLCIAGLSALERTTRYHLSLAGQPNPRWFSDLASALMGSRSEIGVELRVEILSLIVQWLYKEGRFEEGFPLAQKALALAVTSNAPALQRKAWNHIGILNIGMHSLTEATVCFVNSLAIANEIGDRVGKCAALANLAAARLEAGLIDESIKLNQYVVDLVQGDEHLRTLQTEAHHNIALGALLLEDLDLAKVHMESTMKLLHEPSTQLHAYKRIAMELTFTKILVKLDNRETASERAKLAEQYAGMVGTRPARIQSELAKALLDAVEGRADIALTRLSQVEELVRMSDPGFRDFLEVELICNRYAGRDRFTRYYNKKHLSSLAEFQRSIANRQVGAIRKILTTKGAAASRDLLLLPRELRESPHTQDAHKQLEALALLAELREEPAGGHSLRVGHLAASIALAIGFTDAQARVLELAARLHDIGKLAIPDSILLKRQKLSNTEVEIMRRHTTEGCQMLTEMLVAIEQSNERSRLGEMELLRFAAEIALHHHEWWDGSGYPRRIVGTAIPQIARITALADVFDELTHARPYKKALSPERALEHMGELSGRQFDPDLYAELVKLTRASQPLSPCDSKHNPPFLEANRIIERIVGSCEAYKQRSDIRI